METALVITTSTIGVLVAMIVTYRWARFDRPRARTTPLERLITRNPHLNAEQLSWSRAAYRVRFGWITKAAVSTALFIAVNRTAKVNVG